jgi:predicted DNA-binding transcriptional regulator AlpA
MPAKPKYRRLEELSEEEPIETLVPDPQVVREFGICSMTLFRWTRDPKLGFPQPVKINGRCYRSRREIEEFKQRMLRKAVAERAKQAEVA